MNEPRNKYKFGKADGVGYLESNIIADDNDESTTTSSGSKSEARQFCRLLVNRLSKFNLEVEKTKSKLILFGRFAVETRKRRGFKNAETFDFLGFTHYCAKSKNEYFRVKRKTSIKKFRAKVKEFNQWIKFVRNKLHIRDIFNLTKQKLRGNYQYMELQTTHI